MTNKTTKPFQEELDSGWSIQFYNRDRRLICCLYPSHGWIFLFGITLGLLLAVVGFSHARMPSPAATISEPLEAPLRLE